MDRKEIKTQTQPIIAMDTSDQSLRLRRNIGLLPGMSYVAGGIIGVGIFVSPQSVLSGAGQSVGIALCVWAFCAILAVFGGLTYAEYGTRIRKSGGSYTYIREAFGDLVGFVFLWTHLIIVRPMAAAVGAMAAAEYILRPEFLECPELTPRAGKTLIAICILFLLVFANCYSTTLGAVIQTASTICKLAALVTLIVFGLIFLFGKVGTENLQNLFIPQQLTAAGLTLAIYSCTYAYAGWDNLNNVVEEVKNPQRNIPIAILLGVGITAIVYLLVLLAYHTVLTKEQVLSGVAVAVMFCEVTVPQIMWVIVLCIGISAMGIVNVIIFASSRLNFIGGRDKIFPEVLSMVSVQRRTPVVSLLVLCVLAFITIIVSDLKTVLGAYALFRAAGEIVAVAGIFRIRRKFHSSPDTYVVPTFIPVTFLVLQLTLASVAIAFDTSRYAITLLLALAGVPIYFLSSSRMCRSGPFKCLNDCAIKISRRLLLCEFASKTY